MKKAATIAEVRREVAVARLGKATSASSKGSRKPKGPGRIGFVPTMGALHEGHLSLVDRARTRTDFVVMSVFVNPLQFGPGEDYQRYPRDLEGDARLAEDRGVDLLFAPAEDEMYPGGALGVRVVPKKLADRLCGLARPGHFEGVLTVVAKLFGIVQPDVAVFGQKDYQQSVLVRRLVQDLSLPIEIDVAPIVREPDGVAMSSRNAYLSEPERRRAHSLSEGLMTALDAFTEGVRDAERLKARARGTMRNAEVEPEYVELVDPDTLEPLAEAREGSVLAVAARIGTTRLIDNVILG